MGRSPYQNPTTEFTSLDPTEYNGLFSDLLSGKALLSVHSLVRGSKHSTSVIVILMMMKIMRMTRRIRRMIRKRRRKLVVRIMDFGKAIFFAMRMIAGQLHHYDYDKRTSIAGGGGLMV